MAQDADGWRSLVCTEEFTWDCTWALATIWCESDGNANAVGSEWYRGHLWYFYGLWQIAHPDPPGPGNAWLLEPYANTVEAHLKYVSGGGSHWPNCP